MSAVCGCLPMICVPLLPPNMGSGLPITRCASQTYGHPRAPSFRHAVFMRNAFVPILQPRPSAQ